MKKSSAIFFLILYLLSSTEAHQLLKLPVFFQHFKEHKKEDKNISMFQFLTIHYLHSNPRDNDYERDMQLPFKTSGDCLSSMATGFIPTINEISFERPFALVQNENGISKDQFLLSSYLASIWQPPKSC